MPDSILTEAARIRAGSRQTDYGDAVENFRKIALVASILSGETVTCRAAAAVHIATKIVREGHRHKRDNLVDLAGYADIFERIAEAEIAAGAWATTDPLRGPTPGAEPPRGFPENLARRGYTEEGLDRDNPFNQWHEGSTCD